MAQFLSSVIYYSTLTRTKKYFCATRKHTEGTFLRLPRPKAYGLWLRQIWLFIDYKTAYFLPAATKF